MDDILWGNANITQQKMSPDIDFAIPAFEGAIETFWVGTSILMITLNEVCNSEYISHQEWPCDDAMMMTRTMMMIMKQLSNSPLPPNAFGR